MSDRAAVVHRILDLWAELTALCEPRLQYVAEWEGVDPEEVRRAMFAGEATEYRRTRQLDQEMFAVLRQLDAVWPAMAAAGDTSEARMHQLARLLAVLT